MSTLIVKDIYSNNNESSSSRKCRWVCRVRSSNTTRPIQWSSEKPHRKHVDFPQTTAMSYEVFIASPVKLTSSTDSIDEIGQSIEISYWKKSNPLGSSQPSTWWPVDSVMNWKDLHLNYFYIIFTPTIISGLDENLTPIFKLAMRFANLGVSEWNSTFFFIKERRFSVLLSHNRCNQLILVICISRFRAANDDKYTMTKPFLLPFVADIFYVLVIKIVFWFEECSSV